MSWYLSVLKNYAGFSGRARRKEYWMFSLFNIIALVVLIALAMIADGGARYALFILYLVYLLGVFVPSLAVFVRRMHDQGKSGAWFFVGFIPFIGGIWLLVLTVMPGNLGPNQYGPDPRAITA